jgi:F-type H+-transporting ATPase subunit c
MLFITICILTAGLGMAIGVIAPGLAMGNAIKAALEGTARNPGVYGKLLTTMMIGLAMIESLAIYVLVICLIILYANPYKDVALELAKTIVK